MVRGCQRRVIFVKNTGSEMFDEALFFVGEDTTRERSDEDMIREADRIISEEICDYDKREGIRSRPLKAILKYGISFIIGALSGSLLVALML